MNHLSAKAARPERGAIDRIRAWISVPLLTLMVLIVASALLGGSARADVPGLLFLRPLALVAVVIGGAYLLQSGHASAIKTPFILLAALIFWVLCQLVPLPPSLWHMLPDRELLADIGDAAGLTASWPISIAPAATRNALFALAIPAASLLLAGCVPDRARHFLPSLIVGVAATSAFVGLMQLASGSSYFYEYTNYGTPVGFLANRNHQALLLSLAIPAAAYTLLSTSKKTQSWRMMVTVAVALFLFAMILLVGSRAGLALGVLGTLIASGRIIMSLRASSAGGRLGRYYVAIPALAALFAFVVYIAHVSARAFSIGHALESSLRDDRRFSDIATLWTMIKNYLPWGSGEGTFDTAYRIHEPDFVLAPEYFNHVHNDLVELAITGGIPALCILACFVVWWAWATRHVFARAGIGGQLRDLGQYCSILVGMVLLHSLVDYPLRVPLIACLASFAVGCLAIAAAGRPLRAARNALP